MLRGNPGQRKLNASEPRPPQGPAKKPTSLSTGAAAIWDELAPVCESMRTLTPADRKAFATLCELQATLERASSEKNRDGFTPFLMTTITDSAGNEHPKVQEHPAIKLERATAAALRPYYEKFGLEPVGRARISVPKAKEPESKWGGKLA